MANFAAKGGPVDRRIGARIRSRRELLGLSQGALAAKLGCQPALIEAFEAGQARAGATTLMLLTQILKVDVGYLFAGLVDDTPPPAEAGRRAGDGLNS
ncbi:MAG TPA: helix-turn-helix transcriptional regulator [Caulobacteraceae bacterium]|jgi:transcriptional regulator with XRE-family HTH domain|nr:helix-turn-helix transcriptional regulator [Caulobacteraceae bacterium]